MADDNLGNVRLVINNAEEIVAPPPDDDDQGGGGGSGGLLDLPAGCPVTPLGVSGEISYYLDAMRQLREVHADKHSRLRISHMFGAKNYLLEEFWPRKQQDKETGEWTITGWKPEIAAAELMASSASRGLWDAKSRQRGRGAWLDDDGRLLLHCGDVILVGGKWHEPGVFGRYVYPAGAPIMRPSTAPVHQGHDNPVEWLFALLNSWNWRRKDIDALLLLGWIGASILGGALDWRPLTWITGGSGTGKSTLHELIGLLFGENGLLQTSSTTSAGVWQTLQHDTIPVNIDELEARADNRKTEQTIDLARWAASGAKIFRGGGEHKSVEFTARCCFLFSSEFIPPLRSADRNRMAILELEPLGKEKPPLFDADHLRKVGEKLRRRLVDGWPRLTEELDTYRSSLAAVGHTARGQDVFGTLLAVANILLHDHAVDGDTLAEHAKALDAEQLAEISDNATEQERCLQHMGSTAIPLDASGFTKRATAEWVARALSDSIDDNQAEAARVLGMYGLKIVKHEDAQFLAVANSHVELNKIFEGTPFLGGVWSQALRRLDGAVVPRGAKGKPKNIWFPGGEAKATLLPIALLVDPNNERERRSRREPELLPTR